MEVLVAGLVVLALSAGTLRAFVVGRPDLATAATVFCGVFVQALPFLAFGVVISGLIARTSLRTGWPVGCPDEPVRRS
ncbi:MAG: uncharacterized protein QOH54_720 [Mycobacterium sp.]|jgi:uncharacterized membrane protein YraQ (UPF0718 family)|nr:uncharacterized protein [Mycobacterium sp.]MDT5289843.1 uncharacterized protein [Mycobacterium sp.]